MNYYVMIPGFLFENDDLTITDKVFVGLVIGLSGETGYCYASNEKLALYLRLTIPSVKNIISRLYAKDVLENIGTKFDRKLTVKYIEKTPKPQKTKFQNNDFDQDTKSQIETRKSQIETSTLLYINKNKDGQMTKTDQTKSLDTSASLSFSTWYNLYPKKVKKQRASKLFEKLPKKDLAILLQATKLYIAYKEQNQEYFANPDTFLNQKVYLDFLDDIQHSYKETKKTDQSQLIATTLAKKIVVNEGADFSAMEQSVISDSKITTQYAHTITQAELIEFLKPYIKDRLC